MVGAVFFDRVGWRGGLCGVGTGWGGAWMMDDGGNRNKVK